MSRPVVHFKRELDSSVNPEPFGNALSAALNTATMTVSYASGPPTCAGDYPTPRPVPSPTQPVAPAQSFSPGTASHRGQITIGALPVPPAAASLGSQAAPLRVPRSFVCPITGSLMRDPVSPMLIPAPTIAASSSSPGLDPVTLGTLGGLMELAGLPAGASFERAALAGWLAAQSASVPGHAGCGSPGGLSSAAKAVPVPAPHPSPCCDHTTTTIAASTSLVPYSSSSSSSSSAACYPSCNALQPPQLPPALPPSWQPTHLPPPPPQLVPNVRLRLAIEQWLREQGLDHSAADQLLLLEWEVARDRSARQRRLRRGGGLGGGLAHGHGGEELQVADDPMYDNDDEDDDGDDDDSDLKLEAEAGSRVWPPPSAPRQPGHGPRAATATPPLAGVAAATGWLPHPHPPCPPAPWYAEPLSGLPQRSPRSPWQLDALHAAGAAAGMVAGAVAGAGPAVGSVSAPVAPPAASQAPPPPPWDIARHAFSMTRLRSCTAAPHPPTGPATSCTAAPHPPTGPATSASVYLPCGGIAVTVCTVTCTAAAAAAAAGAGAGAGAGSHAASRAVNVALLDSSPVYGRRTIAVAAAAAAPSAAGHYGARTAPAGQPAGCSGAGSTTATVGAAVGPDVQEVPFTTAATAEAKASTTVMAVAATSTDGCARLGPGNARWVPLPPPPPPGGAAGSPGSTFDTSYRSGSVPWPWAWSWPRAVQPRPGSAPPTSPSPPPQPAAGASPLGVSAAAAVGGGNPSHPSGGHSHAASAEDGPSSPPPAVYPLAVGRTTDARSATAAAAAARDAVPRLGLRMPATAATPAIAFAAGPRSCPHSRTSASASASAPGAATHLDGSPRRGAGSGPLESWAWAGPAALRAWLGRLPSRLYGFRSSAGGGGGPNNRGGETTAAARGELAGPGFPCLTASDGETAAAGGSAESGPRPLRHVASANSLPTAVSQPAVYDSSNYHHRCRHNHHAPRQARRWSERPQGSRAAGPLGCGAAGYRRKSAAAVATVREGTSAPPGPRGPCDAAAGPAAPAAVGAWHPAESSEGGEPERGGGADGAGGSAEGGDGDGKGEGGGWAPYPSGRPLELPLELPLQWLSAGQLAQSGLNPCDERQAAVAQEARVWRWLQGAPQPAFQDLFTMQRCMPPGAGPAAPLRCRPAGSGEPHRITSLAVLPPPTPPSPHPTPFFTPADYASLHSDDAGALQTASSPPPPRLKQLPSPPPPPPPAPPPPTRGSFAVLLTQDRPRHVVLEELPPSPPPPDSSASAPAALGPAPALGGAGVGGRCWAVPVVQGRVTAVAACPRGGSLAVGTSAGLVFVWRCFEMEALRDMGAAVGARVVVGAGSGGVGGERAAAPGATAYDRSGTTVGAAAPAPPSPSPAAAATSTAAPPVAGAVAAAEAALEWHLCGRLGWPDGVLGLERPEGGPPYDTTVPGGKQGPSPYQQQPAGSDPHPDNCAQGVRSTCHSDSDSDSGGGMDRGVTALAYDGSGCVLFAACRGVLAGWKLRRLDQPERRPAPCTDTCVTLTPEVYGYSHSDSGEGGGGGAAGGGGDGSKAAAACAGGAGSPRRIAANKRFSPGGDGGSGGGGAAAAGADPTAALLGHSPSWSFSCASPVAPSSASSGLPHPPTICCLAASPSGAHLAFALVSGAVHLAVHADLPDRTVCVRLLPPGPQPGLAAAGHPHPGTAVQLAFTSDDRRLLVLALGLGPGRRQRQRQCSRLSEVGEATVGGSGDGGGGGVVSSVPRRLSAKESRPAAVAVYSLHCFPLRREQRREQEEGWEGAAKGGRQRGGDSGQSEDEEGDGSVEERDPRPDDDSTSGDSGSGRGSGEVGQAGCPWSAVRHCRRGRGHGSPCGRLQRRQQQRRRRMWAGGEWDPGPAVGCGGGGGRSADGGSCGDVVLSWLTVPPQSDRRRAPLLTGLTPGPDGSCALLLDTAAARLLYLDLHLRAGAVREVPLELGAGAGREGPLELGTGAGRDRSSGCRSRCLAVMPGAREVLVGGDCGLLRWHFGAG